MTKRLICFMLCALLLAASLPAMAEAPQKPQWNEALFDVDFNDGKSLADYGFTAYGSKKLTIEELDEERGKSLRVRGSGEGNVVSHIEAATSDSVVMRFSYFYEVGKGRVLFRYATDEIEKLQDVIMQPSRGRFSFTSTMDGRATLYQNERAYLMPVEDEYYVPERIGEWNDVTIYFDYPHSEISYFLNDRFIQTKDVQLEKFWAFDIACLGDEVWLDDISVYKLDKADELEGITKERCPEKLWDYSLRKVDVTLDSGHVGNIYTATDSKVLEMALTERAGEGGSYKLAYDLRDEYGKSVWTGEDSATFLPYESVTKQVRPENLKYGCYWLYTTVSDDSGYSYESFTQLSMVNTPPRGYVNKKFGVNIHVGQFRPFTWKTQDLLLNAGLGVVRDGFRWYDYQHTINEPFTSIPAEDELLKFLAENDITYICNINALSTPGGEAMFGTETYTEAYGKLMGFLAGHYKEMGVDYALEAVNEWNHSGQYPPEGYAQTQKAMYINAKAADPNAITVSGATSGVPAGQYYRAFDSLDGEVVMDANSHHTYDYTAGGPEVGEMVNSYNLISDILKGYGYDVPIWLTEVGWSVSPGHATQTFQNRYMPRLIASQDAYGLYEVITQYDLICDGASSTAREANFGLVEGYLSSWDHPEELAARGSYLALANYNALIHDATFTELVDVAKGVYCYRYKQADGSDILFMVAGGEDQSVGLKLGCDSVTVYDMYGNATEQHSVDGVFSFFADKRCIYIEGSFGEITPCDPVFNLVTNEIQVAPGSLADIQITKATDRAVEIAAENGGDVYVTSIDPFANNQAKIHLGTNPDANGNVDGLDAVTMRLLMDGRVVYSGVTDMEYVPSVSIQSFGMTASSELLSFWDGILRLKSNQSDVTLNGKLTFTSPQWIADIIGETEITNIIPAAVKTVPLNLTGDMVGSQVGLKLELDNGEVVNLATRLSSDAAHYAFKKPTIDGKTEEGEWNLTRKTRIRGTDPAVWLDVAMMWDEENLYFYGLVKDVYFMQQQTLPTDMWRQDSIQAAFISKNDSANFTELGFALMESGPVVNSWYLESGMEGKIGVIEGIDLAVSRINGENTLYEAKLPWNLIIADPSAIVEGGSFKFDVCLNNDDAAGRTFLEYGYGIASAKDVTRLSPVLLLKEPW